MIKLCEKTGGPRIRRLGLQLAVATGAAAAVMVAAAVPSGAATIVSQSTAQAVNLNLGGALTVAVSPLPTSATNDGTGPNNAVNGQPLVSALSGQSFLGAGALAETAEANQDGSSYACSGVVSPNGGIQVGNAGTDCTATDNGTGGVTVDLSQIPGLGTLIQPFGLKLTADAVIAHAQDTGTSSTGGATIAGLKITGNGGLLTGGAFSFPVTIPSGVNQPLGTAILSALTNGFGNNVAAKTAINALFAALAPLVSLTSNFQTPIAGGGLAVSALHIQVLGQTLTADLAKVTVGPNAPQAGTPMMSAAALPWAFGALGLIALGAIPLRRRFATHSSAA